MDRLDEPIDLSEFSNDDIIQIINECRHHKAEVRMLRERINEYRNEIDYWKRRSIQGNKPPIA